LVAPRCLQHRAPAKYELLNRKDRPVTPTLAGYPLKPGGEYRLRVELQDSDRRGVGLQVVPPPRFLDWPAPDSAWEGGRELNLRTRGYLEESWVQMLRNSAEQLPVRIDFADGRQAYEFQIPIVLPHRWMYVPAWLAGPLLSLLFQRDWPVEWRIVTAVGSGVGLSALCFAWDLWRKYRGATQRIRRLNSELERAEETATQLMCRPGS
jgi:hypothetical protein